jgi:hypothetical protein
MGIVLMVLWFALGATSCGDFTPEKLPKVPAAHGYYDLRGCIHVHSNLSRDGCGTIDKIRAKANSTGLDFIVLTDHGRRSESLDSSDLIIIGGAEYGGPGGRGHLLGIGHRADFSHLQTRRALANRIRSAGGLAIAAHPLHPKTPFRVQAIPAMDGMEIFNLAHAVAEEAPIVFALKLLIFPLNRFGVLKSMVDVPRNVLELYDHLLEKTDLLGVGSTDAHGCHGLDYAMAFSIVQTHVLARERSVNGVLEALRSRRAYISFEYLHPVERFEFLAISGNTTYAMGSTVSLEPGLRFLVSVAPSAEVTLLRHGTVAGQWENTDNVNIRVEQPGVYRVEVRLRGKIWILSNPIRVTER